MKRRTLAAAFSTLGFWMLGVFAGSASASVDASKSFAAVFAAKPPPLSADFHDPVWKGAVAAEQLMAVSTRTPAKVTTTARILYDAQNLYVAVECDQSGVPITANQSAHNIGFGLDDFAGVGIDTSGNGAQVYYFESTPRGVRYQQASESARYAPVWTSVARIDPSRWTALLVIPINILRTSGSPVQRWRFNVVRHVAATNENQTWAFDPLMNDTFQNWPNFGDARFWPYLDDVRLGAHAARARPRAEVYALGSLGKDRTQFQLADGSFAPQGRRNAGLDFTYPLTGTISGVGTLAPDFSNVEIDQQTIAPQEFRRGLNEYRPFFAQGAEFFKPGAAVSINGPPNSIFYSPGIGPFNRGAKIEGTYGLQSLGLLEVKGAGFDDTVVGLKHNLANKTFGWWFDGVFAHHQTGNATADARAGSDSTVEAGVSGRNLHTGFVYAFNYAAERGTFVDRPGLALRTEDFIDVHRTNYEVNVGYKDIGPLYNPVDGFTNVSDVRGPSAFVDFNAVGAPGSALKKYELFLFGDRLLDRSGAVHQADWIANLDVYSRRQLHLGLSWNVGSLRLYDRGASLVGYPLYQNGHTFPFESAGLDFKYKEGTQMPAEASYSWGPFLNFYLQQTTFSTSRQLRAGYNIAAEIDGTRERFFTGGSDGQWLRRVSLGRTLGTDSNLSVSLRSISGRGGFGSPGVNLAASYHRRFRNDGELFVNFGTPAAPTTLNRTIVKYLVRFGGGAGV